MRSLVRPLYLSLLPALWLTASPVHAALVTYADVTSFNLAAPGTTSIGFESISPTANSFRDFSTVNGLVISGVTFVGFEGPSAYDLQVVNPGSTTTYYDFGTGASLKSPSYNSPPAGFVPYIHVVLPADVTAFGLDLMTISPNALIYQAKVSGSTFNVQTATRPTQTFFGVTSDVPIPFIDFSVTGTTTNGGTYGLIDNVQFGTASPSTPEGATFLLIGSGLVVLRLFRKRLLRMNTTSVG